MIAALFPLLLGCAAAPSDPAPSRPAPIEPALRAELLALGNWKPPANAAEHRRAAQARWEHLKELLARHGWPTVSMVSEDGAYAAWGMVRAARDEPAFQAAMLAAMEPLLAQREASPTLYAELYDQLHTPQRYGTRGRCVDTEIWQPDELEDPEHVEARRAALGLQPLFRQRYVMGRYCLRMQEEAHRQAR